MRAARPWSARGQAGQKRGDGAAPLASGDGAALRPVRTDEDEPNGISAKSSWLELELGFGLGLG